MEDKNIWERENLTLVAEIKYKSPFDSTLACNPQNAFQRANEIGDIISVHTNPLWGGSIQWLTQIRRQTNKPILAKGFHPTICDVQQAFNAGANFVLTVGWWPHIQNCWHECESLEELEKSQAHYAVWNARNPRTGEKRAETFEEARSIRKGWLCQASLIFRPKDIHPKANAALIGTSIQKD